MMVLSSANDAIDVNTDYKIYNFWRLFSPDYCLYQCWEIEEVLHGIRFVKPLVSGAIRLEKALCNAATT